MLRGHILPWAQRCSTAAVCSSHGAAPSPSSTRPSANAWRVQTRPRTAPAVCSSQRPGRSFPTRPLSACARRALLLHTAPPCSRAIPCRTPPKTVRGCRSPVLRCTRGCPRVGRLADWCRRRSPRYPSRHCAAACLAQRSPRLSLKSATRTAPLCRSLQATPRRCALPSTAPHRPPSLCGVRRSVFSDRRRPSRCPDCACTHRPARSASVLSPRISATRPLFRRLRMPRRRLCSPAAQSGNISPCPDGLVACTQAPAAPSSSANVGLAVGLSLGIGVPALAILALVVVAWRRGIFRKVDGSGRDAFLSGYVAKNPSLAAMEVPRDAIQLRDELGRGEFGVVYRANVVVGGRPRQCAAKLIREGAGFQARVDFFREGEVMMGLPQHAHVVQCVGVSLAEEPMMLLIEYVAHGSAHDFVADIPRAQRNNPFVADMLGSFSRGIAAGMGHLVAHSIVHRDLAARNVLIGTDAFGEYIAKVADFGLSRDTAGMDYYRKEGGVKLPIRWTSPEALDTRVFTTKSDVWSFGVTAWELYSFGAIPYGLVENAEVPLLLAKGHRLERPPCCPMDVFEVLMACWSMDPAERPTFDEIFASLEEAAGIARSLPGDDVLQQLIATKHRDSPFGGSTGSIYDNVPESDPNFYSESMLGRSLRRMAEAQRASSQSASVIVGEGSRPSSPGPSATYDNVWDGSTSPISRSRSPSSKKPHKIYENVLERSLKSELRKMGGEKESPSTARALGFESSSLRDALAAAISRDHSLGARRTDEIALETIVESTV
eukprot:Opistho-1_new@49102